MFMYVLMKCISPIPLSRAECNHGPLVSPGRSHAAVHRGVQGAGTLGPVLDAAAALAVRLPEQHVHPGGGVPGAAAAAAAPAPGPGGRRPACGFRREEEEFFHLWEGLPERGGRGGQKHILAALGDEQRVPAPPAPVPGHLRGGRRGRPVQLAGAPEGTSAGQGRGLPPGRGGLGGQHALPEPRGQPGARPGRPPRRAALVQVAAGHGGDPRKLRRG